jgi:hypothetical protein
MYSGIMRISFYNSGYHSGYNSWYNAYIPTPFPKIYLSILSMNRCCLNCSQGTDHYSGGQVREMQLIYSCLTNRVRLIEFTTHRIKSSINLELMAVTTNKVLQRLSNSDLLSHHMQSVTLPWMVCCTRRKPFHGKRPCFGFRRLRAGKYIAMYVPL